MSAPSRGGTNRIQITRSVDALCHARQLAADVFGPHEIPRWPFIPLAAPLVLLAYLKLRRIL